jgi:hypothetical protein
MRGGSSGEVSRQFQAATLKTPLFRAAFEIHADVIPF